jgi:glutathione S-transferase
VLVNNSTSAQMERRKLRLLYTPAACSISSHIVLEEIGEPFETQRIAIMDGETRSEAFLSINPKGKIPVLILDDQTIVTENPVILQFLARMHPEHGLLPGGLRREIEALEVCEYLTGTVQNFGIARLFRPALFCEDKECWDDVRKEGERVMLKGFELIAPRLAGGPYLFDQFSIADASLFYFELHASRLRIAMPVAVRSHFDRMLKRPAVQKVLAREELNLADFLPGRMAGGISAGPR